MKKGIKVEGDKVNGCRLKGKDIKNLFSYCSGILVYKENLLLFIGMPNKEVKGIIVNEHALEPFVFISDDFCLPDGTVHDDYEYIIEFQKNYLWIRDGITQYPVYWIKGVGY
jgi:hypothetical protein